MGAALFALIGTSAHATSMDLGHVIHGAAAGIGFIGTGTILKREGEDHIRGLTTAASIWMTAAVGLAAGAGSNAMALMGALAGFGVLRIFATFSLTPRADADNSTEERDDDRAPEHAEPRLKGRDAARSS